MIDVPSFPVPVVFLLEDLDFGGTQTQTLELASRLDRTRFEPRLVTLRTGARDLAAKAAAYDLPWLPLTSDEKLNLPRTLYALWRYLARKRPPLLQLLTVLPNIWGRIFGRCLRLQGIIGCCRGLAAVRGQHERLLGRIPGAHVANAGAISELLINWAQVPAKQVFFIPNGVNTDYFTPALTDQEPDGNLVLCIARLAPVKNHRLLLDAFALVLPLFPEASLLLVGEGECRADLEQRAAAEDLRGRVFFHSGAADVRPFLHRAGVFVLSSDQEGTPNALLEAMACGLPVVATRTGGCVEAIEHERSGLLVPCNDAPALAGAIARLLGDAGQRAAFGRAARARIIDAYSMQNMVREHEKIYERLLQGCGKGRS
ncbi:glycosyltransferase [Desulfovibrio sp. OttesenSCG-928-F20]|nr:glycosyltransferase [Desulfovibrio sp. OttesenSCG-928-F20]